MAEAARHAYAFYATSDEYAIAVLVAAERLRRTGSLDGIDVVVLHLALSPAVISRMHGMGLTTREVEPLPLARGRYFRHCLLKFRIFELEEYDRIVYMDADALPLGDTSHLFSLPFSESIAAPDAYWLEEPCKTSALLVVKPSEALWRRIEKHFHAAAANGLYDMDILNLEFRGEIHRLPADCFCLDSEWADTRSRFLFGDSQKTYETVKLVHFSAFFKPWYYHPNRVRRLYPEAHAVFYELWDEWWNTRNAVFPERFREKRLRIFRETRQALRFMRSAVTGR